MDSVPTREAETPILERKWKLGEENKAKEKGDIGERAEISQPKNNRSCSQVLPADISTPRPLAVISTL